MTFCKYQIIDTSKGKVWGLGIGDWGLAISDWGLGIGDWGLGNRGNDKSSQLITTSSTLLRARSVLTLDF